MGAQNFDFALKFPKTGVFQPEILHVLEENFPTAQNLGRGTIMPLCPCHDATYNATDSAAADIMRLNSRHTTLCLCWRVWTIHNRLL